MRRWRRVISGWDGSGAWGPVGAEAPHVGRVRPVFPSLKFLGFYPRNLPAAGTVGRDGQGG